MKVERKIHPNCSEWDDFVEPDYYEQQEEDEKAYVEEIKEQIEKRNWDK